LDKNNSDNLSRKCHHILAELHKKQNTNQYQENETSVIEVVYFYINYINILHYNKLSNNLGEIKHQTEKKKFQYCLKNT
jgi:hypothetical protein